MIFPKTRAAREGLAIVSRAEKSRREYRTLVCFLAALEAVAVALLAVGFAIDNESLRVASYALGMPVAFALLSNIGLYLNWRDRKAADRN